MKGGLEVAGGAPPGKKMKTRRDEALEQALLRQVQQEEARQNVVEDDIEKQDESKEQGDISPSNVEGGEFESEGLEMQQGTAYEMLGFRSVEPAMRPPILPLLARSIPRVTWASRDCTHASTILARIRPRRPLEAAFFDRLEAIRRVATSEVAKAANVMEAVAILGITLDREAILLAAEEILGVASAKARVLVTDPGDYEDLVAELATTRKPRIGLRKRDSPVSSSKSRVEGARSKPGQPYVYCPFRGGGTWLLCAAGCPREEESTSSINISHRRNGRFHVSSMENVEKAWSPSSPCSMVTQRGTISLERKCPQARMEYVTTASASTGKHERVGRRNEKTRGMWGIYSSTGQRCYAISSIYDPESVWRHESYPRSKSCKCPHRSPHFTLRGVRDAAEVVRNSNWLCALDLRHGYQQVLVAPEARRFLGAVVNDRIVVSTVLPFGLNLSPYIFT